MSSAPRPTPSTTRIRLWSRHLRRALGAENNPLGRPLDRARSRALLLAALGIALAAPLSTGAALVDVASTGRHATVTAAHLHRLDAVVLTPARQASAAAGAGRTRYEAEAAWTYPPGQRNTGTVDVYRQAATGSTTSIWVGDSGQLATAPPSTADVAYGAACVGVFTLGLLCVLVASGLGIRLSSLDRRAADSWRRSWAQVEPVWTGRASREPGTSDTQRG